MKKLRLLILLALALTCLFTTAWAAGIPAQQPIADITDVTGEVTALTDDDPATAWIKPDSYGTDLTLNLYGASVGEIWLRNGYAYTNNWYNHYDRADQVKVTVYYRANQYTTSYDTYRYRLVDAYQPNAWSDSWNSGYQRLLLPKKYTGVSKIELTVESVIRGYGNAGVAISDVIVAGGSHATATPRAYATATPKPYVVYVTPTPGPEVEETPLVEYITPRPTATTPEVELITPRPTFTPVVELITPKPTFTPVVELITPNPTPVLTDIPSEPLDYPSDYGVIAPLTQSIATRSGPNNGYDEPGSFFSAGDMVKVLTKSWDNENELWWLQVEFKYDGKWYRAYTTEARVDVDLDLIAEEPVDRKPLETVYAVALHDAYFGPGEQYASRYGSYVRDGSKCEVYIIEGEWAQVAFFDYGLDVRRRTWVPLYVLYGE